MAMSFHQILKDLGITDQQLRKLAESSGLELAELSPKESEENPTLTPIEIKIEQHQGILYAYRLDNDQFLGQGPDREQLIEHLKKNLTDVRLIVAEENGAGLITQK